MTDGTEVKEHQKQKIIRRIKRRLLPCLLAGFCLPVTLFMYGPFDLFAQNRAEFAFSLYDFLLPCLWLTLACGAILSVIPFFLKKKVYALYLAVLFWASVMTFVQGNYLNFGLSSLAGDGVGSAISAATVAVNTAIWALTLAATVTCVLLFKPVRQKLKAVISLGLCVVLIMQATGTVAVCFGDGVFADEEQMLEMSADGMTPKMLTTDNLTTLSENKNVVIFVVDRFDARYYREAAQKYPEIFSELEGFTSFSDYVTLYARTFPAVTSIITGAENDFSGSRKDYLNEAYSESEYLKYMSEQGYGINIYTDGYYAYDNAAYMQDYTQNVSSYSGYTVTDRWALFGSMLALSLYRYLPFALKSTVDDISTDTFSSLVEYYSDGSQQKYASDNREVWEQLTERDFSLTEDEGRFTFIHVSGCHTPSKYDSDWNDLSEPRSTTENVMRQSFKIISRYLSEMKRLGVYDDATVIITGDHAAAMSDKKPVEGARVTAMLVKPSGVGEGETVENTAPCAQKDIWATVFDCEGFSDAPDTEGTSMFRIDEGQTRERRYVFHRIDGDTAEELVYRINGNANDFSNWELVSTTPIHSLYD